MKKINRIKNFWTQAFDAMEDIPALFFAFISMLLLTFATFALLCVFFTTLIGIEIPRDVLIVARISFFFLLFVVVVPFLFKDE